MKECQPFQIIVVTPPDLVDASLAIAASRAGEIGVLDLEFAQSAEAAREAVDRLVRYGRGRIGVKLSGHRTEFFTRITSILPESLGVVILTCGDADQLQDQLRRMRRDGRSILLECTSLEEARVGERVGFDGVIAKGHEAGGRVGEETTFILLQRFVSRLSFPIWAQGGVGLHTVAACYVAGARGVILDSQLYLTRESPLAEAARSKIAAMDGSETTCLGQEVGECYRVHARSGMRAIAELREQERQLAAADRPRAEVLEAWRRAVHRRIGWEATEQHIWLLGQDAAFAAPLAQRFRTVAGVLQEMRRAVHAHCEAARVVRPLGENAPLAESHRTRYPIVQGPMTRVSDTAAFALSVAEGGALPFLALALMSGLDASRLMDETRRLLGDRPWAVGILGFVPLEFREAQLEAIRACRPPFALIAGGRPDQARTLEREGIPTYLHVPSPGLLKLFLAEGAQRFVFEGRECGGHVGPRSSFVLWESMIEVLLEHLPADRERAQTYHCLFAGGIHDSMSASMVAVMAAPLAERGIRIGVLMGTAYLFTKEAVASGAIVRGFQEEALRGERTVLLETAPGHLTRCLESRYVEEFLRERRQLVQAGRSHTEIQLALEAMNLGRLRIASKGIARGGQASDGPPAGFATLSDEEQRVQGMYMVGQAVALRSRLATIEDLHHDVAVGGTERLEVLVEDERRAPEAHEARLTTRCARPSEIAIIGMSCILPNAPDLRTYWRNILNKVNAITEVPPDRWEWTRYYDPDPQAKDRVYSRWGGFIEAVPFDPIVYGIPPSSLSSIEPLHLLALEAVRAALKDADYLDRPFERERTSVILGAGGAGDLAQLYGLRSCLPKVYGQTSPEAYARLEQILPEWTEDSFAGILMNVAAGRVANRFDLGGVNFTVDAACASSLAAVHLAVKELEDGTSDMVIVGGADTFQSPFVYLCFSKSFALSPTGQCRTFDAQADGIAISEGIGIVILKRLSDAERDGDRIYAVIKGVGAGSDGRKKGLMAPSPEGQVRALRRAYAKAGISPATVGLIEAHGTGTVAGDRAELEALSQVIEEARAAPQSCAIGSVKSMIGHTKSTAGVAGLIKTALALYYHVLPPTLGVQTPNPKMRHIECPLYINSEPRPWLQGDGLPRRAGVSAFGFGGTNFHAVLEEYTGDYMVPAAGSPLQNRPAELLIWRVKSRRGLLDAIDSLEKALAEGARPPLPDLAYSLYRAAEVDTGPAGQPAATLALVAASLEDLGAKLALVRDSLTRSADVRLVDPRGVYFSEQPLAHQAKIAFLFPGQGSQYPDMLRDLAIDFTEVREQFERADRALSGKLPLPLSAYVFPPPSFSEQEARARREALLQTNVAQPAVAAAGLAVFHLLGRLGVRPDIVAGHSFGEYVALCAAGVFLEQDLFALSEARGRFMIEAAGEEPGTMAAVEAGTESVRQVLSAIEGVVLANYNGPQQTVIGGARLAIGKSLEAFKVAGIPARLIPVACAFHSPIVAPAQRKLAEYLSAIHLSEPKVEVFSNTTAEPHPRDPRAIATLLVDHLVRPIRFVEEIEALYAAGTRIFVEVGPRNVLSGLTDQILGARPHLVAASDQPGRSSVVQLLHLLGRLAAEGLPVQLERLFAGVPVTLLNLDDLPRGAGQKRPGATVWLVDGGKAWPAADGSEPDRALVESSTSPRADPDRDRPTASTPVANLSPLLETLTSTALRPTPAPTSPSSLPFAGLARQDTPAPAAAAHEGQEVAKVMSQFQQLMNRFLETQQQVMQAYLWNQQDGGRTGTATHVAFAVPGPSPPSRDGAGEWVTSDPPSAAGTTLPEGPGPLSEEALASRLLRLVSDRTGYPTEMLNLDLDLEADLGIDSIKRIEILGNYHRLFASPGDALSEEEMEKLGAIRTLRGIIEWTMGFLRSGSAVTPGPQDVAGSDGDERSGLLAQGEQESSQDPLGGKSLCRYTVVPAEACLPRQAVRFEIAGVVVLTDDENGIAQGLADQLVERGHAVALIRAAKETLETSSGRYVADLASPEGVSELLELIRRRQGSMGGLVHLLPLKVDGNFRDMDLPAWRGRLRLEVKSLFYLARGLQGELQSAAQRGGACLLAATGLGGAFATGSPANSEFFPGQGGVAGLMKTLAQEWPEVRVKVIDLNPLEPSSALISHVVQELFSAGDEVEVGYQGERRLVLRPTTTALQLEGPPLVAVDRSWVILLTGGARGITGEIARHLAVRYQSTLLLVGRTPLPAPEEPPETVGLSTPQQLKAALMARLDQEGQAVTLAKVEAKYDRLLRDREIRGTLAAIERAGARAHYFSIDVRDETAFGSVIDGLYETYGRIDGVIHGAGVIEDKLVKDKLPESFDRVFDTKVDGAFILSRRLRPDSLKFLVFFASAAGRFGNRGQGDYAAANEVVNKLALYLDRRWAGRVVAVNWGPWAKVGMVGPELERRLALRGIELISPQVGCRSIDDEIRCGRKGEAEVLLTGGGSETPPEPPSPRQERTLPMLREATTLPGKGGAIEVLRRLDPLRDRYLYDHQLNGSPVLPMALACELMAEVAALACSGLELVAVRDLQVLHGIVMGNGPRNLRIVATPCGRASGEATQVEVTITDMVDARRPYYRAVVELASKLSSPGPIQLPSFGELRSFPLSAEEAYRQWLFQGPLFRGLVAVHGVQADGISGSLRPSFPDEFFTGGREAAWLLDPVVIDSGLQLLILWTRLHWDMTPLPSRFRAYWRFGPLSGPRVDCRARIRPESGAGILRADLFFHDGEGRVLGVLEDVEGACRRPVDRMAEGTEP